MLAYLKYLLNPQDNVSLKRIINVPNRKVGDTTFEKISNYALTQETSIDEVIEKMRKGEIPTEELKITPQALTGVKNFILVMQELRNELPHTALSDFIELLVKKIQYRTHLVKEE